MRRFLLTGPLLVCSAALAQPAVSGTITGWDGTRGRTIQLEVETQAEPVSLTPRSEISEAGKFTVPLPPAPPADVTLGVPLQELNARPQGCASSVRAEPPQAGVKRAQLAVYDAYGRMNLVELLSSNKLPVQAGDVLASLVYADRPVVVQGEVDCPSQLERWRVSLRRGWNWIVTRASRDPGGSERLLFENQRAAEVPAELAWFTHGEAGLPDFEWDLVDGGGFVVMTVGAQAAERGLQVTDRLVQIEGRAIEGLTPDELDRLLAGPADRDVQVEVERAGRRLELSVPRRVVRYPY